MNVIAKIRMYWKYRHVWKSGTQLRVALKYFGDVPVRQAEAELRASGCPEDMVQATIALAHATRFGDATEQQWQAWIDAANRMRASRESLALS
jgi:hypothetical protein